MEGGVEVVENREQVASSLVGADAPRSRLGVLRHRHFRNVWLGSLASNIGGWMEATGIQWVMTTETLKPSWTEAGYPSAPVMLAYLSVAQMAPMLVLGLPGGLLADRVNRKRLLILTQVALMVTAVLLATLAVAGVLTPWVLMTIGLAHGIAMAFNIPAWQVLTPRLVPRNELTRAIHLNGIAFNLARVVGPGLGGLIMGLSGASWLFVVNAASFVAVLFAIVGTPDAPAPPHDGASAWERTREATRFVFRNRGPLRIFIAMVLFSMLAVPLMRMLPIFAADVYRAETDPVTRALDLQAVDLYGVMLSMMGVGAVVGGLLLKVVPSWYPKHHFIPLSMLLGGVSIAVWSMLESVALGALAIFFCGMFWLWSFNTSMAAMQMLVDDRMRGRVLAVCNTAVFGAMPLGSLIAGYLGHYVSQSKSEGPGAQIGVGVLASVLAVAGLVMLIWRTPEIDGLKPGESGYERRPGLMRGISASGHRPQRQPQPEMNDPPSPPSVT